MNPPMAITAVSVDRMYPSADCEPIIAADRRVVVAFNSAISWSDAALIPPDPAAHRPPRPTA